MSEKTPPLFRFAPSPNGELHLGHAYSALVNAQLARQSGGQLLLRIEDIDIERCRPEYESQMLFDLEWLGIEWHGEPRRQSDHFDEYREALDVLQEAGLLYRAFMSRSQIRATTAQWGDHWPSDPDGVPHYPGEEREWSNTRQEQEAQLKPDHALRLAMDRAIHHGGANLVWHETGNGPDGESGTVTAQPAAWGDVVLGRAMTPASYHLAVVVDDALQGITHVVRGNDLFHATSVHRLLQQLLGLGVPEYHHHTLVLDEHNLKLSKSRGDTSLRSLREAGMTPGDIARMVGFGGGGPEARLVS